MNVQGRKWLLTINNPRDAGFDHNRIIDLVATMTTVKYFCLSDEIGDKGKTPHTHVFIYSEAPIRFTTIKKRFPTAHIDKCYGSCKENRDYISKEGAWADSDKADTSVKGSFFEHGKLPTEKEESNNTELIQILDSIECGASVRDILKEKPNYALKSKNLSNLQTEYYAKQFGSIVREVEVVYIYDIDGTFDRNYIYAEEDSVCRITNYSPKGMSFDNYHFEDAIIFDNFEGSIKAQEMCMYLDGYPLHLPARFQDRMACYTTVYIISDKSPLDIYVGTHKKRFLDRIHRYIACENGQLETIDEKEIRNE